MAECVQQTIPVESQWTSTSPPYIMRIRASGLIRIGVKDVMFSVADVHSKGIVPRHLHRIDKHKEMDPNVSLARADASYTL
jgi:hypothetical protein